jgi:UTP--glucose-1-phosphate uridylyltransferase
MKIRKAVFPVGGWGTRFLPATKTVPKSLFPIIDKPVIHHAIEETVSAGVEEVVLVTGPNSNAVEDYFSRSPELESFLESRNEGELVRQVREISTMAFFCSTRSSKRPQARGLGVAILNARDIVGDEPFAVVLPNDVIDAEPPCLRSLVDIYEDLQGPVIAVHRVPVEKISTYGNVAVRKLGRGAARRLKGGAYVRERVFEVTKLIQKPDPRGDEHLSDIAIIGRYALAPELFAVLEGIRPGREGEVQLTDALEELRCGGRKIYAYEFEGAYFDTRSKIGYLRAILNFALKQPELAACVRDMLGDPKP